VQALGLPSAAAALQVEHLLTARSGMLHLLMACDSSNALCSNVLCLASAALHAVVLWYM